MIMTQQTSTIGALLGAWQQAGTNSPVPATGPRFDLLLLEMTKPLQTAAGNGGEKAGTVALSPKVQAAFQSLLEGAAKGSSDTVASAPQLQLPTPEQIEEVAQALSLDSRETEQLRTLVTLVVARVTAQAPQGILPAQANDETKVAATSRAIPEANPGPQGGSPVTSPNLNSEPEIVSDREIPRKALNQDETQGGTIAIVPLALAAQTQAPALVSTRTQGAGQADARVSPLAGQTQAKAPIQVTATSSPASDSTQSPQLGQAQASRVAANPSTASVPSAPLTPGTVTTPARNSQAQPQGSTQSATPGSAQGSKVSDMSRPTQSGQAQPESKRDLSVQNIATQNSSEKARPLQTVVVQARPQASTIVASAPSPVAPENSVQNAPAFQGVEFLPSDTEAPSAPGTEIVLDARGQLRSLQAPALNPAPQVQAPAQATPPAPAAQLLASVAQSSSVPTALASSQKDGPEAAVLSAPSLGSSDDSDTAPARTADFSPQLVTGSPVRAGVIQLAQPQDTLSRLIHQTLRDYGTRDTVLKQTVDALQNLESEDGHLRIRLKPESLGQLDVVLSVENGRLSARLVASSIEVRDVIAADLRQFKQGLEQQGLQVQQLSVSLRAETQSQGQPQQQPQQSWAQQNQSSASQNPAPSQGSYEGYGEVPSQDQRFSALA